MRLSIFKVAQNGIKHPNIFLAERPMGYFDFKFGWAAVSLYESHKLDFYGSSMMRCVFLIQAHYR